MQIRFPVINSAKYLTTRSDFTVLHGHGPSKNGRRFSYNKCIYCGKFLKWTDDFVKNVR